MKDIPAFPVGLEAFGEDKTGMTLRDYFAAKAMQGMFASQGNMLVVTKEYLAETSYEYADAMMKAREA